LRIGPLADSALSARRVGHVRRLWVASPAYLKRRGTPRTPAELTHHEALLGTLRGNTEWQFAGARRGAPPRLNGRLRADDVETRLRAAREGRGIAQLLSYQVADELAAGRLVRLLQAFERPPLPVHLVTKGRAHRAPKIDAFLDFAARRLVALPVLA
jgi:DNA-binding transcriptional LysR family regulator